MTAVLFAASGGVRSAHASPVTFNVSTTLDEPLTNPADTNCVSLSGCSLRAALKAADNRGVDTTTINVPGATYTLALGALRVGGTAGETVIIAGSSAVIVQAPLCSEPVLNCMVFFLDPNGIGGITVNLSGLTIEGGNTANAGGGGGILAGSLSTSGDALTISNSTISGNKASGGAPGGGIAFAHGTLTLSNDIISGNQATGGGSGGGLDFSDVVVGDGGSTLTVTDSSFNANTTDATLTGGGGGLHLLGALSSYSIINSTFTGNTALAAGPAGGGGAILKDSGSLTITGSTFTGNSAGGGSGGGIFTSSDATNLGTALAPGLNRFAANTAAAGSGQGLFRDALNTGTVTAEDNWWGTNTPNTSDAAKNVPLTAWFVLKLSASPPYVLPGGSTTLTGDLSHSNLNAAPGLLSNVTSIPVSWPGPTLGTISGAAAFLDGSRQATATYTAGGASGTGTASVQVDSQTVTVNIPILAPISISKAFGAATVPLNGTAGLTFTLTNPNPSTPVTGIGFTDSLPSGLVVATPNGLDGTCVGTRLATAGSNSISASGITLSGGASCTVTVSVVGTTVGVKNNVSGPVVSNEAGTGGTASASIGVLAPPSIDKTFNPANIALNGSTSLSFLLINPNTADALTGVGFTDPLPAGLSVAAGTASACGGTVTTTATTITLSGATLGANVSCSFPVIVTGAVSGDYTNTTGPITSTNGGSGNTASASLLVALPPTIVKSFGATSIPLNGTTSLTFTIANQMAAFNLSGVGFTDSLPAGLVVATSNGLSGSCGAGTISAVAGSSTVSLADGTLPGGAVCTISVNVTGTTVGVKSNAVQVTSTEGGPGNVSNASLTVVAPPSIGKSFGAPTIPVGGTTPLTFLIGNPNSTVALTGVGFMDTLPAGLVVATPPAVGGTCTGSSTATAGGNSVNLTGSSLPASGSCSFTVNVTGTTAGTKHNTSGNVTSTEAGTGGTASASIDVLGPPVIAKAFSPITIALNATSTLTFTITNSNSQIGLNGVSFTDTLPAGLTVANSSSSVCGGTLTTNAPTGISLSGASLPGSSLGFCSFSVTVTGSASGAYLNTTGNVTSANGGTGNAASATLTVASPPTIVKSFGAASVPVGGSTTLSFTVANPNSTLSLTGVGFTDSLPAGLVVASANGLTGGCDGGAVTAVAGSSLVSLTGAALAPSGSCTITVNVTGTTAGQKNNAVQVTSNEGGTGNVSNASLTVVAPPTISKAFGSASVPLNGSTTLTFTTNNPNAAATLTGVGFSDTLPAGLVVSTPNGFVGGCDGGLITAAAGSSVVSLSGASIAPGATCSFAVSVTATTAGSVTNVTGNVSSNEGGSGATATASLAIVAPPSISKAFALPGIPLNGVVALTFTITNPNPQFNLTGVGFTDTLPAGLTVPVATTSACGGTLATTPPTTITLFAGTVAAGSSCSLSVTVTGAASGNYTNTTGLVTSDNGGTGNTASASLLVASPPTIVKSFGATSVPLGGSTTLTFTIANPNTTLVLTGVAFTDSLPAGLAVATSNGVSGSCGGGTITAAAGSSSISLGAATLAPATSCSFSVNVTGTTAGIKNNSVQVTSTEGGAGNTSNASVTVVAPPTISKSFGSSSIPLNGSTTLTFTITNPNGSSALTGVGFSDTLPGGLVISNPSGLIGSCGGGAITAAAGTSLVSLTGATIQPGGSCTFVLSVTGTSAGGKTNVTGNVTSNEGGNGGTATASLAIVAPPSISKAFALPGIPINGVVALTFTITNPSANTVPLTGVAFSDVLPAALVVSTPNGQTGACDGGTIVAIPGAGVISLSGATIGVGVSCTFSINITGVGDGSKTNTTSPVTSTSGGTGNTATAFLEVASPPTIVKSFGAASVPVNGSTTLTFTLTNPNTVVTLSGVGFTDSLPAGLAVASPNGLSGSCGGGTITAAAGSSTVSLANGAIAPGAGCTFAVNVTGTSAGVKNNSVQVTSNEGGAGNTSSASTTVVAPAAISKVFGAASIPLNGTTALSFTISNPNATITLTGISFTDTLPAGLVVSTPNGLAGSCGGGVITAVTASSSISLSGGTLAAEASCTFSVNVTGTAAGNKDNTTSPIASNEGGAGATASATILVVAPPSLTKAFGRAHISRHHSTTLTFTITNPNPSVALTDVGFTDNLPAGLVVATPNGLVGSCGAGTIVAIAGTGTISLTGATLAPNTSCTFAVRITATKRGSYTNVTGPVSSTNGGVGNTASAHLRVTGRGDDDNNDDDDGSGGDRDTPRDGF